MGELGVAAPCVSCSPPLGELRWWTAYGCAADAMEPWSFRVPVCLSASLCSSGATVSHPERPPWLGLAVFVLSTCAGAHVSRSSEPLCPKEPVCRLRASWFSACELDCHGP